MSEAQSDDVTAHAQPLALPAPEDASSARVTKLDVSQQSSVKMDHLGPMVVNSDGTLSRIANWATLTEAERERTLRVLGKRNALRQEKLKADDNDTSTSSA